MQDPKIELHLRNFQKYENPVCFTFDSGITLLNGRSGSGKSTICRAIHFVLFGGRKHKNISCKSSKSKDTMVTFRYISSNYCFDITRTRPSESIHLLINNTHKMEAAPAQSWINSVFGTEDSWICSSYLAQDKLHFFLRETNDKKKDLLKQIVFGDENGAEPEEYTNVIYKECSKLKQHVDTTSNQIKARNFIILDIVNKTPNIYKYGGFDANTLKTCEDKHKSLILEKSKIEIKIHEKKRKEGLELELSKININEDDNKKFYESFDGYKKLKEISLLKVSLVGFDEDVLTSDIDDINRDIYLYKLYFENGYNKDEDIGKWIENKKSELDKYTNFLSVESKNNEIEEHNRLIDNSNSNLKREYNGLIDNFNRAVNLYESHKRQKKIIEEREPPISSFSPYEDDDDLTSSYLLNKVNEYKSEEHVNFLSVESKNNEIEEHNRLIDNSNSNLKREYNGLIDNFNRAVNLYESHERQKKIIEERKPPMSSFSPYEDDDDLTSSYLLNKVNEYKLIEQTNALSVESKNNEIVEHNKLIDNMNSNLKREYNALIDNFNNEVNLYELYEKQKKIIGEKKNTLSDLSSYEDDDDLSSSYLINKVNEYKLLNSELNCPNCDCGLILKDDCLHKGTLYSESLRVVNQLKMINSEEEIIKRKTREVYDIELDNFNKITPPTLPEKPKEPEYSVFKERIVYVRIVDQSKITNSEEEIIKRKTREAYDIEFNNFNKIPPPTLPEKPNEPEYSVFKERIVYVRIVDQLKITNCEEEIIKRKTREAYNIDLDNFNKITPPTLPEKPNEPEYSNLKELIAHEFVRKPTLNVFDKPKQQYSKVLQLSKSYSLIDTYETVKTSPYKDMIFIESDYNQMVAYDKHIIQTTAKINHITSEISKIKSDDVSHEDITKVNAEIELYIDMVDVGKKVIDIIAHQAEIARLSEEEHQTITRFSSYEKLSTFITQIANSSITDIISSLNDALEDICGELFGFPISIALLTTKELKNGNEKNMVNMTISYNGNVYQNPDELSGGELRRVSLALMLAFCRINNSPVCIIDEVLSSISNDYKEACLNIIKRWTVGKFVIHICHGITEGFHDNTIDFE